LQSSILGELHAAGLSGEVWVNHRNLFGAVEPGSDRLVDLFKAKPDWCLLIAPNGRDLWRLNLSDRGSSRMRQRAFQRATSARNRAELR